LHSHLCQTLQNSNLHYEVWLIQSPFQW
jgi:hypothetical protein